MIIKARTRQFIQNALKEDIGVGDLTTTSIVSKVQRGKFIILAKEPCVVCGMVLAETCFDIIDDDIHFRPMVKDGEYAPTSKVIAHIEGRCKGILTAERTALNFISWLSGISTLTDKFVNAVKTYKAQIMDTRKTIPTLRYLQKYAVRIGGGKNHRMGLYDEILIKDNHLAVASRSGLLAANKNTIKDAVDKARKNGPRNKKIEIEVKTLPEFKEALAMNCDIIMLDNMKPADIKTAIQLRDSYRIKKQDIGFKTLLEVSGNINLDNVAKVASLGVDRISIGALTHSAPAIDFSLKAE